MARNETKKQVDQLFFRDMRQALRSNSYDALVGGSIKRETVRRKSWSSASGSRKEATQRSRWAEKSDNLRDKGGAG